MTTFSYRLPRASHATRMRVALMMAISLAVHVVLWDAFRQAAEIEPRRPPRDTLEVALIAAERPPPPPVRRARPAPPRVAKAAAEPEVSRTRWVEKVERIEPVVTATDPAPAPQPTPEPAPITDAVQVPQEAPVHDLAAELAEVGVSSHTLPSSTRYTFQTVDSRYAGASAATIIDWRFDRAARSYDVRLNTRLMGMGIMDIVSVGRVTRAGLAPERFTQKVLARAALAANFDAQNGRITYSSRSHERALRIGTQDWLSFQFQLMLLAQNKPEALQPGGVVEFPVSGPRDLETYRFLVIGEESIDIAAGPVRAVKLDRPRAIGGANARIEVWLAPELNWLPVKVRFTDRRNNFTESSLESVADVPPDAAQAQ
jgi:hypothetical protein